MSYSCFRTKSFRKSFFIPRSVLKAARGALEALRTPRGAEPPQRGNRAGGAMLRATDIEHQDGFYRIIFATFCVEKPFATHGSFYASWYRRWKPIIEQENQKWSKCQQLYCFSFLVSEILLKYFRVHFLIENLTNSYLRNFEISLLPRLINLYICWNFEMKNCF